ncbi:hypothetical protein HYU16_05290 [Candidatus Woesearchaeota archaeon]|nr:hypothetical protein [Candidatus Woesearchaeota archaeon]
MEKEEIDFDGLEDAQFQIEEGAFQPKTLTCTRCGSKAKKSQIEVVVGNDVSVRANGFECEKCGKRYLGLEEAKKLDRAMIVSRVLRNDFKMERAISYDGDNWTMRIPKEFAHGVHKKKAEIMPLGARQFCVSIE